jgi:UDP-N-acetylglucosamine transferase subunit ALG13
LDHFFLTEDTALSRSLGERWRTYYVAHFALGQARLGAPGKFLRSAVSNIVASARIIFRERPDVVLTTGAGAVFPAVFWARLLGAKIIVVESFARFEQPSMFMRIAGRFAHQRVVQSAALAAYASQSAVFDPLKILEGPGPSKRPFLFATVGATLSFDRLVDSVATLKLRGEISEEVLIQTGIGGLSPDGLAVVETLTYDEIQAAVREADIVVCHGGTGSIITALRQGCRVIVMPRLFEKGEHYDNHQSAITNAFVARGLVEVAHSTEELSGALKRARAHKPVCATTEPVALINYLKALFTRWARPGGIATAEDAPLNAPAMDSQH